MLKLTSVFKKPCNFHSNSPQRAIWESSTIESNPWHFGIVNAVVTEDGHVFINKEKHITGVINTRVEGGKWERINYNLMSFARNNRRSVTDELAIFLSGYVKDNFKGAPRVTAKTKVDYMVDYSKINEVISAK